MFHKDSEYQEHEQFTMKFPINNQTKANLLIAVVAIILLTTPINCFAAEKSSNPGGIETLNEDTLYEYDLNGDGKNDTIQYKVYENDEKHTATLKLYINKILCLTKTEDGLSFNVSILDIDQSDGCLDLFIHTIWESDGVSDAFFVQYNGTKLFHTTAFDLKNLTKNFNTYRYSLNETDGKGIFTIVLDTPVYSPSIGCYCCYVSFQLKDGKITKIPAQTYTLSDYSKEYPYKAAKSFSAYKTAGSKTVVYKVKKGDTVNFDKMYVSKTGKVYFRMNNNKGNNGWIASDLNKLFRELPAWG